MYSLFGPLEEGLVVAVGREGGAISNPGIGGRVILKDGGRRIHGYFSPRYLDPVASSRMIRRDSGDSGDSSPDPIGAVTRPESTSIGGGRFFVFLFLVMGLVM